MLIRFPLITAVALLTTGAGNDAEIRKEMRALQGTWRVTSSEDNGEITPQKDIMNREVVFTEDRMEARDSGKVIYKLTFKLDPTQDPKTIDLKMTEGPNKGQTDRAIYLLDGNTLKICVQQDAKKPRPKEFSAPEGSSHHLVVLKRFK